VIFPIAVRRVLAVRSDSFALLLISPFDFQLRASKVLIRVPSRPFELSFFLCFLLNLKGNSAIVR